MKSRYLILLLLLVSVVFFILGLSYPIMSTRKQVLGLVLQYQEIRLFDSVKIFFESREYLLASIIFLFTIVLPVFKYIEIINRSLGMVRIPGRIDRVLHLLDKWSMLDVFLIALLLLNFKMNSTFIVMEIKSGTLYLAISIIMRMATTMLIDYQDKKFDRKE